MKDNIDNVVVIDIESDGYDGVIIFDVPKRSKKGIGLRDSLRRKYRPSHVLREGNRVSFEGAINIDDDDDDAEVDNNIRKPRTGESCSRNGYGYAPEFDSDSSQVNGEEDPNLGFNGMPSTSADASDDCVFVGVRRRTHGLYKCGKASAEESCSRNRYGYFPELSDSSESELSDCEILDGSHGKAREQWEKASKRKKSNAGKDHSGETQQNAKSGSSHNSKIPISPESESAQPSNPGPATESPQKADQETVPGCSNSSMGANPSTSKDGVWQNLVKSTFVARNKKPISSESESAQPSNPGPATESPQKADQETVPGCSNSSMGANPSTSKDGVWQNLVKSTFVPRNKKPRHKDECDLAASKGKNEVPSDGNHHATQDKPETSGSGEGKTPLTELVPESQLNGESNPLCEENIINEREKMKETEEYKRVIEEEWEARQQQLRIQAEEARRLRKRKKAEALRILDMQKRQKQRLEEVRETQKKDEEDLNAKELLRVEVRKELSLLESRCIDLASVLRSLGITVGGGFHPASNEVHAAYKRALLKFHPDRASRTDIRQQVEAEEKFKLISRMKEKLFPSSLCR